MPETGTEPSPNSGLWQPAIRQNFRSKAGSSTADSRFGSRSGEGGSIGGGGMVLGIGGPSALPLTERNVFTLVVRKGTYVCEYAVPGCLFLVGALPHAGPKRS